MKHKITFSYLLVFLFFYFLIFLFFCPGSLKAGGFLVKSENNSAVYYVDLNGMRHAFPNEIIFRSWYGNNFSGVQIVSDSYIQSIPLGKNIVMKAGKYLVKIPSLPQVYAVEPGGTLRHIKSAQIAETFYGSDWQQKLVDLSEVFFNNYVIAEPIEYDYQIPDGVVYQYKNDYYYKSQNKVKKFASFSDVLANGYEAQDVVKGFTTFLLHGDEIRGYSSEINNLEISNNLSNYDCETKNLKGAFIFVYNFNYTQDQLNKINDIKSKLSERWAWATDELSDIDLNETIFLIKKKDYHIRYGDLSLQQVAYDFYDDNQDSYDFLFVFDNFSSSGKVLAQHNMATNHIKGNHKQQLQAEVHYGSKGKLKAVINMLNIKAHDFETERQKDYTLNNMIHEMLHQWSGSLIFLNNEGEDDSSLLTEDGYHWSNYVNFRSPLGGLKWQENEDGSFSYEEDDSFKIKLANLDLYAMGLLPKRAIGEIFYLIPTEGESGNDIEAIKVLVSGDQLVQAMGQWSCSVD